MLVPSVKLNVKVLPCRVAVSQWRTVTGESPLCHTVTGGTSTAFLIAAYTLTRQGKNEDAALTGDLDVLVGFYIVGAYAAPSGSSGHGSRRKSSAALQRHAKLILEQEQKTKMLSLAQVLEPPGGRMLDILADSGPNNIREWLLTLVRPLALTESSIYLARALWVRFIKQNMRRQDCKSPSR